MSGLSTSLSKKFGLLIVLICTGFVIQQLAKLDLAQIPLDDWKTLAKAVIVGGVGYGLISISLSIIWQKLLLWSGESRAPAKLCHAIYGRAQIMKYIPGNIFSIAGRHVLGRQNGFTDSALYWAAALEILGMVFISALVFFVGSMFQSHPGLLIEVPLLVGACLAPFILPALMRVATSRIKSLKNYSLPHVSFLSYLRLYAIFLLYLPWFGGAALLMWWIINVYTGAAPHYLIVLGITSGAWLAGYIVPGASGGIGVREALLIVALKPLIGDSIIVITILYRIATITADVVFLLLSLPFAMNPVSSKPDTGSP
jgi:hypothetical protein